MAPETELFFANATPAVVLDALREVAEEVELASERQWSSPSMRSVDVTYWIGGSAWFATLWSGDLPRGQGTSIVVLPEADEGTGLPLAVKQRWVSLGAQEGCWRYPERSPGARRAPRA